MDLERLREESDESQVTAAEATNWDSQHNTHYLEDNLWVHSWPSRILPTILQCFLPSGFSEMIWRLLSTQKMTKTRCFPIEILPDKLQSWFMMCLLRISCVGFCFTNFINFWLPNQDEFWTLIHSLKTNFIVTDAKFEKSDFKSYPEEYLLRAGYVDRLVLITRGKMGWAPALIFSPIWEKLLNWMWWKRKLSWICVQVVKCLKLKLIL